MATQTQVRRLGRRSIAFVAISMVIVAAAVFVFVGDWRSSTKTAPAPNLPTQKFNRRKAIEVSGFSMLANSVAPWRADDSPREIARYWDKSEDRAIELLDRVMADPGQGADVVRLTIIKATLMNAKGEPVRAYEELQKLRAFVEKYPSVATDWLYSIIYCQGVTALRRGENDNCILCRGESSCILPIVPTARHTNRTGSELAIQHFSEYLRQFPDDLEVRWLLNLAYMTLGEHPEKVDPSQLISLDKWVHSEFDIGRFRDIGDRAGVNRFNQSGGAIMDDFDGDGLLDLVVTSLDPTQKMGFYHNKGDGTFEDRTEAAGIADQLGGLYCCQTDYNNDGRLDVYIVRGAWMNHPMRPTLLRNNGNGTFTDVTREAGLLDPVNSNSACWADYDNDGFLDLFVCCERQPNRLFHNRGDGTFEEVAAKAGVAGKPTDFCKGAAWIDFDNDGFPDLFVNNLRAPARLYHNNRNGTFTDVTESMGIRGPNQGFSCWAWDFDNDGWLDIFATSYDRTLGDIVKGLTGQPHGCESNRLYKNMQGKRFVDVTKEAGLDMVFATMGSNFADFDNDGWLDFYLGTGDPDFSTLVPNRMFKNVGGKRFADITGSSGTGNLQKGHSVACGDWRRDGKIDLFVQMGGAVNGDKYHNILFQNPGQGNHWLTVKLVGKKTNRAAIGARIKVVTAGDSPMSIYRHVSSGSSFGGNPLQQTIGVGKAGRIATLEIQWPTSGNKQVFHDIDVNQAIEITEFAETYRKLNWKPISP